MEKHFPIQRVFKQGHVISPMLFNEAWNMPYTNGNLVCRIVELILDTAKFDVYISVQVRLHVKGKELKQIHHDGSTSSRTICCGIAFVEMIKSDLQSKHVQAVLFCASCTTTCSWPQCLSHEQALGQFAMMMFEYGFL